ncbi:WGR domain-containing protein [Rhizobiales bacterium RZME27]|uniref:WGR domain-containing protein n=1 Tax=Endobacterium cereale TaxID=2663029 RepID=A0A6A8ABD6_9HYPH|nr:WGR domain-containing protein [Endobacterium cereale]
MNTRFDVCIYRINSAQRMARFYRIAIQPSLFGDFVLVRRWGRIGTHGRAHRQHYASERDAMIEFLAWLKRKRRRGYGPQIIQSSSL